MDTTPIQKSIMNRIYWVDIFKGIAIILMVIGHTASPISRYIYLFHMPAFFFISGFTTNFSKYDFLSYFKKKVLSLLVPYLVINLIFFITHFLLQKLKISGYFYEPGSDGLLTPISIINTLTSFTSTDPLGGATWFLVTLFETSIFAYIITQISSFLSKKYSLFFSLIFSFALFLFGYYFLYNHKPTIILNYNLDLISFSTFFFVLGMNSIKLTVPKVFHFFSIPLAIYTIYFFANINFAGINFPTRQFNSWYNVLPGTVSGIYLLVMTSVGFEHIKLLKTSFIKLSSATIFILAFHFLIFKLYFLILYLVKMSPYENILKLVQTTANPYWLTLTIFTCIVSLVIYSVSSKSELMNRYVFGKND